LYILVTGHVFVQQGIFRENFQERTFASAVSSNQGHFGTTL
jgi:hypothetical protein